MESTNTTPIQYPGGALWAGHSVPKTSHQPPVKQAADFGGRTAWLHEGLAREVGVRLLDAVERIDALDRAFRFDLEALRTETELYRKGKDEL